jgi:hypothetical protein
MSLLQFGRMAGSLINCTVESFRVLYSHTMYLPVFCATSSIVSFGIVYARLLYYVFYTLVFLLVFVCPT